MRNLSIVIETGTSAAGLRAHVTDEASGKEILSFTLSHDDAARFMMGQASRHPVPAEVLEAEHAHLLGRKCHTYTRTFTIEDRDIIRDLRDGDEPAALNFWADTMRSCCWAQTSGWGLRNGRRVVFTMRRYCNELTDEQDAGVKLLLAEAQPPEGLVSA
jgi:hypothetical protein